MFQRIQTVYILSALILSVIMIFQPFTLFSYNNGIHAQLGFSGLSNTTDPATTFLPAFPLLVLISLITLMNIIILFSFRNRIRQMRLTVYNILLNLGLTGMVLYYFIYIKNHNVVPETELLFHNVNYVVLFPTISMILLYLAFRGIRKDELLVKSYNRLR